MELHWSTFRSQLYEVWKSQTQVVCLTRQIKWCFGAVSLCSRFKLNATIRRVVIFEIIDTKKLDLLISPNLRWPKQVKMASCVFSNRCRTQKVGIDRRNGNKGKKENKTKRKLLANLRSSDLRYQYIYTCASGFCAVGFPSKISNESIIVKVDFCCHLFSACLFLLTFYLSWTPSAASTLQLGSTVW